MIRSGSTDHLYRFLDWFVRRSFEDLLVSYRPTGPYVSDVLLRLTRTDSLYRMRSLDGRTLYRMTDALLAKERNDVQPVPSDTDERARRLEAPRSIILPPKNDEDGAPEEPVSETWSEAEENAFSRHLGELALFLSGLYRKQLDRRGCLGLYIREGERAYRGLAEQEGEESPKRRPIYEDLSDHFEQYTEALDYMGKVYWRGGEGFHRFREELEEEWDRWEEEE